jgi:CheY-like chemotaxis protein
MRHPLAPLLSAARVLGSDQVNAQQVAWCSDVITRQVQRMAVLLDDLLNLSGIKFGRMRLSMAPVGLQQVVDAAVETALPLLQSRQHSLQVELPQPPVHLQADAGRLAQVLTNLLTNAAKYTDPGGQIRLVARRSAQSEGASEIEVCVEDNGIGLNRNDCEHIFEMFSQVEAAPDAQRSGSGGLGIGLALVKGFVELHGGRVLARSEGLGQGSSFTVVLPALAPAPAVAPAALQAGASQVQPRRVLIADDNEDAAQSLALLLQMAGHTTRVVGDGLQAVAACAEFRPQVALLDIGMPGLDGYQVARRLRDDASNASLLLVALTGWGFDENREEAREAGFDLFLTKPTNPQTLLDLLDGPLKPSC